MAKNGTSVSIKAKNLKVFYGDFCALSIADLNLSGKMIAVVGHNGSGKSTLIKTILELLPTKSGNILTTLKDSDTNFVLKPEEHMAYSPENGSVFSDVRVESYIKLWCRVKHNSGKYYLREGRKYIELLDIEPLFKKLGRELSKGQRRRLQTAIAFLTDPRLFLFDEPFDGLDVHQANFLASILQDEVNNRAMVISSHRMEIVERLADDIVVLHNGSVLAHGSVDQICVDLCKHTLTVSKKNGSLNEAIAKLKSAFPTALINQIGTTLTATGPELDESSLGSFLTELGINDFNITITKPSLVDAMNYHLSSLSDKKLYT